MKITQDCLSDESIDSLLQGRLSAVCEGSAQRHLDSCDECCSRLRRRVGDSQWWTEADELLADMDQPSGSSRLPLSARSGPDRQPTSAVIAHLKQWMGPTDDPSKLGRIGSFEVVGIVGVGGAGIVLKALDSRLNRYVAIKTLLPALAHSAVARRRFERESRAVAAITHQHVVPIYAVDNYNGLPYIAMHYVAGESLQRRLDARGPLQTLEVVRIAAQIARALSAAHAQGVVHRDIKPANILLEDSVDRALVTDFGLARVIDEASTHSGAVTGTPQYMSPEQCHGQPADQRSDLFSLGSMIYAMCIGRAPFRSDTLMGMLRKVCDSTPRKIREVNPEIPEWLQSLVERLHQKHPADRFESASQVAEILEAELAHMQSPEMVVAPTRPWILKPTFPVQPPSISRRIAMPLTATMMGTVLAFVVLQTQDDQTPTLSRTIKSVVQAASGIIAMQTFELRDVQTYAVEAGGILKFVADSGHVDVVTGDDQQVRVEMVRRVSADNQQQAEQLAAKHTLAGITHGDSLEVTAKMHPDLKRSDERKRFKDIKFIVTVPKSFNLDVKTAGGHITTSDISGEVDVQTAGGHLTLANVEGSVAARTGGGNIKVGNASGNVDAHTSGGNITLGSVKGTVKAETSGGNIIVSEVQGTIVGETSGGNIDVKISKQPLADCRLSTEGGRIRVGLAEQLKLSVQAKVSAGRIRSPFIDAKIDKHNQRLSHQLNGGGPALDVHVAAGNATFDFLRNNAD